MSDFIEFYNMAASQGFNYGILFTLLLLNLMNLFAISYDHKKRRESDIRSIKIKRCMQVIEAMFAEISSILIIIDPKKPQKVAIRDRIKALRKDLHCQRIFVSDNMFKAFVNMFDYLLRINEDCYTRNADEEGSLLKNIMNEYNKTK